MSLPIVTELLAGLEPTATVITGCVALALGFAAYVASAITGNDSWVDRTWSLVPIAYAWFYVFYQGDSFLIELPKNGGYWISSLGALAVTVTVWGSRLTFNFYRRGGYSRGGEDHRWPHVRGWPIWRHRFLWHLFSFFFISLFQEWLLWAITTPMLAVKPNTPLSGNTIAVIAVTLALMAGESLADEQQWRFQNEKRNLAPRRAALEQDYSAGFLTHGLFAHSRHPNVWCEQSIWLVFYAASWATLGFLNWTGLGAAVLYVLTVSSSILTESISAAKYPKYAAYQKVVPMLIPTPTPARAVIDKCVFGSLDTTEKKKA